MDPYRCLLAAMLRQALKDAGSRSHEHRRAARRWLQVDPACTEICDWLEMDQAALVTALEQREAGVA